MEGTSTRCERPEVHLLTVLAFEVKLGVRVSGGNDALCHFHQIRGRGFWWKWRLPAACLLKERVGVRVQTSGVRMSGISIEEGVGLLERRARCERPEVYLRSGFGFRVTESLLGFQPWE